MDEMDPGVLAYMQAMYNEVDTAKSGSITKAPMEVLLQVFVYVYIHHTYIHTCIHTCIQRGRYGKIWLNYQSSNGGLAAGNFMCVYIDAYIRFSEAQMDVLLQVCVYIYT